MTASDATFTDDKGTNCACCGKFVKKPVKWRGASVGKDCAQALSHVRWIVKVDTTGWSEEAMAAHERNVAAIRRDFPRIHERLIAMASA